MSWSGLHGKHEAMTPSSGNADVGRISIRRARVDDAPQLARLSRELGYPSADEQMRRRLETIGARADHVVLTAERGREAPILGWIHAARTILLESGECAQILGLVVDGTARRGGLGRRLVTGAEQWTRALGLRRIVVRSNVAREASHLFYPALGYGLAKTQRVYAKQLG